MHLQRDQTGSPGRRRRRQRDEGGSPCIVAATALLGVGLLAGATSMYNSRLQALPTMLAAETPTTLTAQELAEAVTAGRLAASGGTVTTARQPNIVMILIDDMGFNDIGYQSTDLASATPRMDELAARGVKLTNYYSLHMCTPARAALLTGSYPHRIGMQYDIIHPDSPWGLPLGLDTMADVFRGAGYATHAVGKWHLGHYSEDLLPHRRGFDSYLGFLVDEMDYHSHRYLEPYNDTYYYDFMEADADGYSTADWAKGMYSTDVFTDRAIDIITAHGAAAAAAAAAPEAASGVAAVAAGRALGQDGSSLETERYTAAGEAAAATAEGAAEGQAGSGSGGSSPSAVSSDAAAAAAPPLFLYLAYQAVHYPISPPAGGAFTEEEEAVIAAISHPERHMFAQVLIYLDQAIGRVVDSLAAAGLEDTVVVVASDNGGCYKYGASNYPLRGFKHFLFEGGVHVPAFVYSPTRLPAALADAAGNGGAEYSGLVHVTDLLPTLAGLAGVNLASSGSNIDGIDQWPAFAATAAATRAAAAAASLGALAAAAPPEASAAAEAAAGAAATAAAIASIAVAALPAPRQEVLVYYEPYNSGPAGLFMRAEARAAIVVGRHKLIVAEYCNGYHSFQMTDAHLSASEVCESAEPCFSCAGLCGDPEDSTSDRETYLFDLQDDPREEHNLWGVDPTLDADMLARLDAAVADSADSVWAKEDTSHAVAAWDSDGGYVSPWAVADGDSVGPSAQ